MPYLPHKTCCPDPVASAAAIPDEANCSWFHQSHHCDDIQHLSCWIYFRNNKMMITFYAISQPRDDTGTWSRRAKTCFMITSSKGSIFRVTGLCAGNSPVTGEFPALRPVTRSFDVLFDMRLDKRLSKQSCGWWFETPSRPLWRHSNGSTPIPRPYGQSLGCAMIVNTFGGNDQVRIGLRCRTHTLWVSFLTWNKAFLEYLRNITFYIHSI